MGVSLQAMGLSEKALPYHEQALAMYRKLYPASKYPTDTPTSRPASTTWYSDAVDGSYQKRCPTMSKRWR